MMIQLSIFQFQCGAIKSFVLSAVIAYVRKFQFQCGAIKSFMEKGVQIKNCFSFQFQCGAIKRDKRKFAHATAF